jgi:hypothetical protein
VQYHLSYGKGIARGRSKPRFPKLKSKKQATAASAKSLSPAKPQSAHLPFNSWFPPDVKTKEQQGFYNTVSLKGVSEYSEELVSGNHTLALKHWERVKEFAKKHPLKAGARKSEAEGWLKKAIMTPEQEVVLWSDASMRNPLSHEGYERFMMAFEKVVGPEQFKRLLGGDAEQVVAEGKKAQKKMGQIYGH